MPDTPELQAAFGQHPQQQMGCGFPTAHLLIQFAAHSGLALKTIVAQDGAKLPIPDSDKAATEREYLKADAAAVVEEFRRRRGESLRALRGLGAEQWKRSGTLGTNPMTLDALVALWAWHDDNHLDQLKRALQGKA